MGYKRRSKDISVSPEPSNKGTPETSSEEETVQATTSFKPCNIDIRSDSPLVTDQKSEGCCLPVTISDVTETILKKSGHAPPDLLLSPQTLVDSRLYNDWLDLDEELGDSESGLESVLTYPFVRMERSEREWDLERYKSRPFPRYCLSGIEELQREDLTDKNHTIKNFCEEGKIVRALKENFREGGNNFPLVGTLKMKSFARRDVSARFAKDLNGPPYHHPPASKKSRSKKAKVVKTDTDKFYHAVVILGLNTMSRDSRLHYCWVKNSHGKKWGVDGFSRVGLDVFVSIAVPSYDAEGWAGLREKLQKSDKKDKLKVGFQNAGVAMAHDGSQTDKENEAMEVGIGNLVNYLDGKSVANDIRKEVTAEIFRMKDEIRTVPGLAVILVGNSKDSETHVCNKRLACQYVGIKCKVVKLSEDCPEAEVLQRISAFNGNPSVHGILVQLPLPSHINEHTILEAVCIEKDVGGFHPLNIGCLAIGREPFFAPCTPKGCIELLRRYEIPIKDKRVVVIGRSNTVGMPTALLLQREEAIVTIVHSETVSPEEITRQADIIISAVGKPDLVRGSWVKPGAVLVDVGTSKVEVEVPEGPEQELLVGDICYKEADKVASAITSVPGGVGPMTIAMLLSNTLLAAKRIHKFV